MKNLFFLSFLALGLVFTSCGDDEPSTQTDSWVLDANNLSNVDKINSGENTLIVLDLETTSLCPNSGVRVVVTAGGTEQYNELIEMFNFNLEFTVSENTDVTIATGIEFIPNSGVVCVTLGEVNCSLTY